MFGLERLFDFMCLHLQADRLTHVIVEARGAKEDAELELEFRRICDSMNRDSKPYPFDVVITSKQANSEGLQLADLTARPIGLSVMRPDQSNRAYEIIKGKLYGGRYGSIKGNGLKVFP